MKLLDLLASEMVSSRALHLDACPSAAGEPVEGAVDRFRGPRLAPYVLRKSGAVRMNASISRRVI
jgi:hypothetical protein